MNLRTYVSVLPHPPAEAFAWHERPGALQRLIAPWTSTTVERFEGFHDGAETLLRVDAGLSVRPYWRARHDGYVSGAKFEDWQEQGPFDVWHHVHRFDPTPDGGTRYADEITYDMPFGAIGDVVADALLGRLEHEFSYRHRTAREDLALHARYALPPLRIAVTGASGLIGTALRHLLTSGGHRVHCLVRRPPSNDNEIAWDPEAGTLDADRLDGVDAVVHLAGESVFAPRWTDAKKERILRSRVNGTALLARTLAGLARPPRVFVSGSAIGIYGDRADDRLTEDAAAAETGFLSDVVRQWEAATRPAEDAGIRTVHLRTGLVVSPRGGALAQMLPAFKLGFGGPLGNPDAFLPWIGIDDEIGAILHAIATDTLSGPVNLAAPETTTMRQLARTLARVLGRPALMAVPEGVLRTLGGQAAEEMLLSSARVVPEKLVASGYRFRHSDLETCLRHLLGRPRASAVFPDV